MAFLYQFVHLLLSGAAEDTFVDESLFLIGCVLSSTKWLYSNPSEL